ncbi:MAG: DUF1318 domain-containing protein [Kiritimatiellae bacterium]|nr:DUF1318 domain-containing protein [Kiritimatiellia bacterium]
MNARLMMLSSMALLCAGCLTVKTEHEVKPIHITMDINLKVDQQIESAMNDNSKPDMKRLVENGAVGLDKDGLFAPAPGGSLSAAELEYVVKANGEHKTRMAKIAEENGITAADVAARGRTMFIERAKAGVWYQDDAGKWLQKK